MICSRPPMAITVSSTSACCDWSPLVALYIFPPLVIIIRMIIIKPLVIIMIIIMIILSPLVIIMLIIMIKSSHLL